MTFSLEKRAKYRFVPARRTDGQLQAEALWRIETRLQQDLGEDGRLLDVTWTSSKEKDGLTVTADAELEIPVGVFSPAEPVPPPRRKDENES